jgi:hypothetical protein
MLPLPGYVLLIVVLIILLGLIWAVTQFRPREKVKINPSYPYERAAALFTPAERSFLGVLEQAVGDQCRIMGKVRLGDIIKVRSGLDASARQTANNKIQSKHLDFVAVDPDDLSILFVVELDDKSHQRTDRKKRDDFLENALDAAGVTLIRFPAKQGYVVEEIRQGIFHA